MQPICSPTWNPKHPDMNMSGNSSANYLIEINQIYTTHEAIVCTKCRRAFEGLDLPAALTIYSVFSNKRQSWHKWYNFFILHWPNKIWLTGLYLVKHSPCSPFFKHIISEFQPFRLVLIALYINILYFSLNITNNFGALYLLSMHSIQYPLGLSLNWVAMIELTTAFCVVGRSHISLGIKKFLIFFPGKYQCEWWSYACQMHLPIWRTLFDICQVCYCLYCLMLLYHNILGLPPLSNNNSFPEKKHHFAVEFCFCIPYLIWWHLLSSLLFVLLGWKADLICTELHVIFCPIGIVIDFNLTSWKHINMHWQILQRFETFYFASKKWHLQ